MRHKNQCLSVKSAQSVSKILFAEQLELISLLSSSMRDVEDDWTSDFAGKWQDERMTDEIIDDIHAARNANMKEVVLCSCRQP